MGQQTAPTHLRPDPGPRVRPGQPAAEVETEPGLRVAAVMAHPDLETRRERARADLQAPPRPLQPEPETRHVSLRRRQVAARAAAGCLRGGPHRHRVGLLGRVELRFGVQRGGRRTLDRGQRLAQLVAHHTQELGPQPLQLLERRQVLQGDHNRLDRAVRRTDRCCVDQHGDAPPVRDRDLDLFRAHRLGIAELVGERELAEPDLAPVAAPVGDDLQQLLRRGVRTEQLSDDLKLWLAPDPTAPTRTLVLVVDGERFALAKSEGETSGSRTGRRWDSSGLSWSTGETVELRLVEGSAPRAPAAPGVNGVDNSDTSLKVTWGVPGNAGPPITHYDLRYRVVGTGINGWQDGPQGETGRNATIAGLMVDTKYDVQVRASNADGDGPWSPSGQGTPGVVETVEPVEPIPNGKLRLVVDDDETLSTTGGGRLEVYFKRQGKGEWGTVCNDRFDRPFVDYSADHPDPANKEKVPNVAAQFACKLIDKNYTAGRMVFAEDVGMTPLTDEPIVRVLPDGTKEVVKPKRIWLDDVRCAEGSTHWRGENSGPPTGLQGCYHAGVGLHNCKYGNGDPVDEETDHSQDVHLHPRGRDRNGRNRVRRHRRPAL